MTVRSEMHGRVGVWTLSRPDALNALDTATLEALCAAAAAAGANPDVRAVVLTGEGRAFAAGADISEMQGKSALDMERFSRLGHAACAALEALEVPTLAAVNGHALGGGCEPCGVHQQEPASERLDLFRDPVPGDSGAVVDQGPPLPGVAIEQAGLPHVRTADDGHDGERSRSCAGSRHDPIGPSGKKMRNFAGHGNFPACFSLDTGLAAPLA